MTSFPAILDLHRWMTFPKLFWGSDVDDFVVFNRQPPIIDDPPFAVQGDDCAVKQQKICHLVFLPNSSNCRYIIIIANFVCDYCQQYN